MMGLYQYPTQYPQLYVMADPSTASRPAFDDAAAEQVANVWKALFPDAAALPVIGYPLKGKGVMTLTHSGNVVGMSPMSPMMINGVPLRTTRCTALSRRRTAS